jgi:hypothetical protein
MWVEADSIKVGETLTTVGYNKRASCFPLTKAVDSDAWVISVDFAMFAAGPLYTQSPTFRCLGAIDASCQQETLDEARS